MRHESRFRGLLVVSTIKRPCLCRLPTQQQRCSGQKTFHVPFVASTRPPLLAGSPMAHDRCACLGLAWFKPGYCLLTLGTERGVSGNILPGHRTPCCRSPCGVLRVLVVTEPFPLSVVPARRQCHPAFPHPPRQTDGTVLSCYRIQRFGLFLSVVASGLSGLTLDTLRIESGSCSSVSCQGCISANLSLILLDVFAQSS